MNILFIAKHKWPHVGGVEKHVTQISKACYSGVANSLQPTANTVKIISEEDIKPPDIKIFGLLYIWYWFLKNTNLIKDSDIVHIHDVFIWYLPFRFIFPRKKVYITFHGWEGKWPLPIWAILNKKMASLLCNGSIAVGNYINKYYGIKSNFVIHGGIEKIPKLKNSKTPNTIVWLGRTDIDTGYFEFKEWLKDHPKLNVKYVTNINNPDKYLKTAEYCAPAGYLSYLEAKSYDCKIMTFANNPLKEDYWKEIKLLKSIPTWSEVANVYLKLWNK